MSDNPVYDAFVAVGIRSEQNRRAMCLRYVGNEYKAQLEKGMENATKNNSTSFKITTGKTECAPEIALFLRSNGWNVKDQNTGSCFSKKYWHSVDENGKLHVDVQDISL